ncbi:rhomboid family intramembrane serine protease [Cardiobacteriaceae bacterium TAE3-ERU3]|nr:rhomboid family intramembrane serine protease [Cardiobacteriaceae bacterium TAE3-ERU3]
MTLAESFKRAPLAVSLAGSFVLIFVLQVLTGIDINDPALDDLERWGANAFPLTMGSEPWRLISSAFIHAGLTHLVFNALAMYVFGLAAEPLFGHARFLAIFLLSAVGGGLLNSYLTWHALLDGEPYYIAVGASGGIMGLGAALTLAALSKLPLKDSQLNTRALIVLMGINIGYGFLMPGIDNAAHIGGALTGALIALAFIAGYKLRNQWISWVAIALTGLGFYWYWHSLHEEIVSELARYGQTLT